MKYELGNVNFKNKVAIKKYIQNIKSNMNVGSYVVGDDKLVLNDLIKCNPMFDEWDIIPELCEYELVVDIVFKTHRFNIIYDGRVIPISIPSCIRGQSKENEHIYNVKRAARLAIINSIWNFRNSKYNDITNNWICEVCLENKTKDMVEIDHNFTIENNTFLCILNSWIDNRNYSEIKVHLVNDIYRLVDEDDWVNYHDDRAILRVLCKNCHYFKKM